MNRDTLEQQQIPIYFVATLLAAFIGLAFPSIGTSAEALITPSIGALMYAMFLQIPFLQLRESVRNKRFMAALLIANFVLMPFLVWALTLPLKSQPAILLGALLVLLTPCIDYVVVFTHLGKGDSRLILSATPVLLVLQLLLLPLYLTLMLGDELAVSVSASPFIEAFLLLIVLPLLLAIATEVATKHSTLAKDWSSAWAWLPVPAMAVVLIVVVGSQISNVARDIDRLVAVLPVYLGFLLLAPLVGFASARLLKLPAQAARTVTFSSSTRNSLVALPLALALPEEMRTLAAAAIITQTLTELIGELIYIRAVPALIRR
ncbi:bile acid:sodium symporter [Pseudomonas sp. 2FG]|uniref:bile acid:sodium symporter n=1 Tax=Pseudomonas sp. 2FG TaxID=2502191 RepID=UPI0010F5B139|nr:bile acid:sodium symporter [Pseudomonas sp. 2FG]